jgi:CSLREA domain-containing protein
VLVGVLFSGIASAATITVNSVADTAANDGACTLREAITAANTNTASGGAAGECAAGTGGLDTIAFNIATGCDVVTGVCTIQPGLTFDTIIEPVTINGYSQTGAVMNSLAIGSNAALKIEIDGTNAGLGTNCFTVTAAGSGSTFQGLVINRFQQNMSGNGGHGILLTSSSNNTISGNFIGTNAAGNADFGNQGSALFIFLASINNTLGGTAPAARNVLSGNSDEGILLGAGANIIQGNYIGTNAAGTAAIGNTGGMLLVSAGGNTIGGTTAGARNVVSGNSQWGIGIENAGATNNVVQGNFIGTDATGTLALGNGSGGGVFLIDGFSGPASNNLIGGMVPGAGNVIAFNTGEGVVIESNSGFNPTGNAILGNSIFSNGALGIDLADNGVTANDVDDPDTGPNDLQNFPVITSVTTGGGSTTIQGTFNSTPSHDFLIEFFSSPTCDPSGNGEGQTFLQSTTVVTDANGDHTLNFAFGSDVTAGHAITATATDLGPIALGQKSRRLAPSSAQGVPLASPGPTSEFSACFIVGGGPTPTPTAIPTATATPSPTITSSPTQTITPGGPTFTPTSTATRTLTPSTTATPTTTLTPTRTITPGGPTLTPSLTFTPTATVTPTGTPTLGAATVTATVAASFTPTVIGGGGGPAPPLGTIPTLSGTMLALLAVTLAGIALLLIRRS